MPKAKTLKKKISTNGHGTLKTLPSARLQVRKTYKLFIDGKFPRSESGRYFPFKDVSGRIIANLSRASVKDVRDAVGAARKAQLQWAALSAFNRSQILYRIAEMTESRKTQLMEELLSMGWDHSAAISEVSASIDRLVYYAGWCDKYQQVFSSVNPVSTPHFNFSVPEPVGTVGLIPSPEKPLLGLVSLMAPVIAGGNAAVLLVSEKYPMTGITFGEILQSSDLPSGVVNLLSGFSKELLPVFSSHMDLNALGLGGLSPELKKAVDRSAAQNLKRVHHYDNGAMDPGPYLILDFQEIKTTWHPAGF